MSTDSWISSDLLRIGVNRAVTRNWPALIPDAQRLLDAFEYVQIDEDVIRSAVVEPDRLLRPWTRSTWRPHGYLDQNSRPC